MKLKQYAALPFSQAPSGYQVDTQQRLGDLLEPAVFFVKSFFDTSRPVELIFATVELEAPASRLIEHQQPCLPGLYLLRQAA